MRPRCRRSTHSQSHRQQSRRHRAWTLDPAANRGRTGEVAASLKPRGIRAHARGSQNGSPAQAADPHSAPIAKFCPHGIAYSSHGMPHRFEPATRDGKHIPKQSPRRKRYWESRYDRTPTIRNTGDRQGRLTLPSRRNAIALYQIPRHGPTRPQEGGDVMCVYDHFFGACRNIHLDSDCPHVSSDHE